MIRYWTSHAEGILESLREDKSLVEQLSPSAFSHPNSPNWQDHSTSKECEMFENAAGGEDELAEMTGSKAHHVIINQPQVCGSC